MKRSGTGPAAKRQGDVISDTVLCLLAYKRLIRVGGVRISRPASQPSPLPSLPSSPRLIHPAGYLNEGRALSEWKRALDNSAFPLPDSESSLKPTKSIRCLLLKVFFF